MVTKSNAYLATLWTPTSYFAFNSIDKNMHRAKRKVIMQALTDRAMREFEPTMAREIDIFLKLLLSTEPIDLTERCKRLAFDIAAMLAYGQPFHLQTEDKNRFMIDSLQARDFRVNLYLRLQAIPKFGLQMLV